MKYTSIIPAQDWFFYHDNPQPGGKPIFYPIAVWATYEDCYEDDTPGNRTVVVGLIAPDFGGDHRAKLTTPPPVPGRYVHLSEMTDEDIAAVKPTPRK